MIILSTLFNKDCILFDIDADSKEEIILTLIHQLKKAGKITDAEDFYHDTLAREAICPTSIGYNISFPHGKSDHVKEACIAYGRSLRPILWNAETGETVSSILLIAVPKADGAMTHLKILASLSRKIMHADFRDILIGSEKEAIYQLLENALSDNQTEAELCETHCAH